MPISGRFFLLEQIQRGVVEDPVVFGGNGHNHIAQRAEDFRGICPKPHVDLWPFGIDKANIASHYALPIGRYLRSTLAPRALSCPTVRSAPGIHFQAHFLRNSRTLTPQRKQFRWPRVKLQPILYANSSKRAPISLPQADSDFSATISSLPGMPHYRLVQYPTIKPSNACTSTARFGCLCNKSVLHPPFHFCAGVSPSKFWCGRAWLYNHAPYCLIKLCC